MTGEVTNDEELKRFLTEEVNSLYDELSQPDLHPHTYFPRLRLIYLHGQISTKVHSMELILHTLKFDVDDELEYETFREGPDPQGPAEVVDEYDRMAEYKSPIHPRSIMDWLETTLLNCEDVKVLTTFFIFANTHWMHFSNSNVNMLKRLSTLHNKLLENKKYAKLKAFERININAFSPTYRPIR